MVKCKFKYDEKLLNKISSATLKTSNLISEILVGITFIAIGIMFVMGNYISGIIFSLIGAIFIIGIIFSNKSISKSNNMLLGQHIEVEFSETNMVMTATMSGEKLYTAKFEYSAVKKVVEKNDLAYLYFDKKSIIILPKLAFVNEKDYKRVVELAGNNYIV